MLKIGNFPYPTPMPAKIWGRSLWSRSAMLGSAQRRKVMLIISMTLFSNNSNACDHKPPTLQTDGQTDGQLTMAKQYSIVVSSLFSGQQS